MMTMLERVARAIGGEENGAPVDEPGERWRNWEPAARAAIAAMREPTEGMLDAPLQYDPAAIAETPLGTIDARKKYESRRDLRPFIYRAMIEAALEEKP